MQDSYLEIYNRDLFHQIIIFDIFMMIWFQNNVLHVLIKTSKTSLQYDGFNDVITGGLKQSIKNLPANFPHFLPTPIGLRTCRWKQYQCDLKGQL